LLSKAIERGISVGVAESSSLLDNTTPPQEKLYGYHRLANPPVFDLRNGKFEKLLYSEVKDKIEARDSIDLRRPPEAVRS